MADRWRTPDGWTVEVVTLSWTPDKHDGTWLRVSHHGFFVTLVRAVAEMEQWFPLADLEPDVLGAAGPGIAHRDGVADESLTVVADLGLRHARNARDDPQNARVSRTPRGMPAAASTV